MELRVLQYFLTIAREESISRAAEFLHITQPTLSRQIKELEEDLGKQLFERGNRRITLTEEGMLLRNRAEEIMNLVNKTEAEIISNESTINGDVYIGGAETQGMRLIAKTIHDIQSSHPDIQFHLYSGNAQDVTDRLDKGLIDFGILIEPADVSKYDFIKLPTTDIWGVLMKKDSPLSHLEKITPRDLKNQPIICSNQEMVRNEISGWLGKDFNTLQLIASYNLIFNAALLVEENVGYALTLDKLVNTECNSHLCFKPLEPKLEVGLTIVWKRYQIFSKASQLFIEELQKQFSSFQ